VAEPAERDANVVTKLRTAGAIVAGKTHTVEYAFGGYGTNVTVGTPWNPWDLKVQRIPGGSSSGTGSIVGAGVLPGGLGTLEELLEIWVSRTLAMHGKPVVVLDPSGVFDPLRAQVDLLVEQGFVRPQARAAVTWARDVAGAFAALEAGQQTPTLTAAPDELLEAEP